MLPLKIYPIEKRHQKIWMYMQSSDCSMNHNGRKLKMDLPYDPSNATLRYLFREIQDVNSNKYIYISAPLCLIAALFTIAKIWK